LLIEDAIGLIPCNSDLEKTVSDWPSLRSWTRREANRTVGSRINVKSQVWTDQVAITKAFAYTHNRRSPPHLLQASQQGPPATSRASYAMGSASSPSPPSRRRWSWGSALAGAATTAAATALVLCRPRDPRFELISISLSAFHFRAPAALDIGLTLTVHATNPNVVPVRYGPSTVSILYGGAHLGTARLDAGEQPATSCRLLHLPARLDGVELAHRARAILSDVARRHMELDAAVEIAGEVAVLLWSRPFSVRIDSHITVDPVFLEVVEQENHSEMQLYLA